MAEIRLSDIWRVGEILLKIYTKEILTSPMGDDALCTNFEQCQEQKSNTNVTKWEPCFLPDYCKIKQTKHHFAACFWMRVHFYVSSLLPHAQTAPLRSTCTYTSTTMMTPPRMQRETTEWSMRSSQGWQKTKLSFSIHRKIRKMFLHLHEVPFLAQDGLRLHVFAFSVPLLFLPFSSPPLQGPVPGVRAEAVLRHGIPVFRLTVHVRQDISSIEPPELRLSLQGFINSAPAF